MHRYALLALALAACGGSTPEPTIDISTCAPENGPFTVEIDNPYLPLPVGMVHVLESEDEKVQISVLDQTREVAGVTCAVIEEREWEGEELVEVSRNWFAQAPDGTVCYFGEEVDDYEDGEIVAHGGAWEAGVDGALPGILMPAEPAVGQAYQQEVAEGVAEDSAEITAMGDTIETPAGTFTDTVTTVESSPLDVGTSLKHYACEVGMIYDDGIELTEE